MIFTREIKTRFVNFSLKSKFEYPEKYLLKKIGIRGRFRTNFFLNLLFIKNHCSSEVMTLKKVAELDAEFIVYKAEAKERMDALEKKFDDGIGKLDGGIGLLKSEVDQKFEELKQLILGRVPTQASIFEFPDPTKQTSTLTSTFEVPDPTKLATKPNLYVPPARRGYDDIGLELHNSNGESSTTIGKNLRP